MGFEVIESRSQSLGIRAGKAFATIRVVGQIYLGLYCVKNLPIKRQKYATVFVDTENNTLGITFHDEHKTGRHMVNKWRADKQGIMITSKGAISALKINTRLVDIPTVLIKHEGEDMVVLKITEGIKRSSRKGAKVVF